MKKKLGILLFVASLLGVTSVSTASAAECRWVGSIWICDS